MRRLMTFIATISLAAGFSLTTACENNAQSPSASKRRGGSTAYKAKAAHLNQVEQGKRSAASSAPRGNQKAPGTSTKTATAAR